MLTASLRTLTLIESFRIAHGASAERTVLRVACDGVEAEAPFVPYYGDDPETSLNAVLTLASPEELLPQSAPRPARLAMDLLRHGLAAQRAGVPLWEHLHLPDPDGKAGCRSFGIPEDLAVFRDCVAQMALQFHVLKLKLGSGNGDFDEAICATAREAAPRATLLADANGGWSPREAARLLPKLARFDLAFVEQPVSHRCGIEAWQELRSLPGGNALPLVADESAQTTDDVPALAGLVDGVNVKLLKCASISGALRMMEAARMHRLMVMLGCMIETQVGITYAAHLAGCADWIDLDGHFYLPDEGRPGIRYDANGALHLPQR